ncbi:MAG: FG-GAP repeat protein [Deltaproteobacteria bacterium]|nr:FG-GAP repeat protein [Deltaproteobacteria bacterium]
MKLCPYYLEMLLQQVSLIFVSYLRLLSSSLIFVIILTSLSCRVVVQEPRVNHDFNGDGVADVIVGAPADDDGGSGSGVVFIFYGSTSLAASIDVALANVTLIGEDASDDLGRSVSGGN